MQIDRYSDKPAYVQIADWLRGQITSGTIPPGSPVPSKRQLRDGLGIGSETYDKAIKILKSEGLVRTARGIGHIAQPVKS